MNNWIIKKYRWNFNSKDFEINKQFHILRPYKTILLEVLDNTNPMT